MPDNKENFLDSKSLIAILFLIISWFAWDSYMKRKYPNLSQPVEKTLEKEQKKTETKEKKEIESPQKSLSETTLSFKGKKMEVLFSSKGLGLKELILKEYKDRKGQAVSFSSFEKPIFSTTLFQNEESLIPFKIKKEGDLIVGLFSSPEWQIKKTIKIEEERFVLKNKIEIKPLKKQDISGLSLFFSHLKPKEGNSSAFSKILSLYGQDIVKTFLFYGGNQQKKLTSEQLQKTEEKTFPKTQVVALGGRYFGMAFINKASFWPSASLQQDAQHIHSRLDYAFLHSRAQSLEYEVFLGPKSFQNLQKLGPEAQKWLDFGFFGWLARPLLLILNGFYSWCGNWGWAIILLTFFVRLVLLPINIKSYKSTELMKRIQPQIKEIREKHKADPKQMNLEVMALMKEQKVNPFGGCLLPLVFQLPIFFALYRVLGESIELYQSPFLFWIEDLSLKDPYFILPVLASLVLFVQQSLTPMNLPKEQARILKAMPLLFSIFMLGLPSGLVLYIFVSGLFALVQQFVFIKIGSLYFKGGENVKTV